jgi:hypothetical protein
VTLKGAMRLTPLLLVVLLGASHALAEEVPMKELQALASHGNWRELLATAIKVKPSTRDADWRKLVVSAAVHVVNESANATSGVSRTQDLLRVVPPAESTYGFLRDDAGYLDAKARAVQRVAAACGGEELVDCGGIVVALSAGIQRFPKGTARRLAELVERDVSAAEALHFWRAAVAEQHEAYQEPGVERAVIGVLVSDAAGAPLDEALNTARTCLVQLESALLQALIDTDDGSAFTRNACPILKARPGATVTKKKKCH